MAVCVGTSGMVKSNQVVVAGFRELVNKVENSRGYIHGFGTPSFLGRLSKQLCSRGCPHAGSGERPVVRRVFCSNMLSGGLYFTFV